MFCLFFSWIVHSKYFSTPSELGTACQEEKMQSCSLVLFQSRHRGDAAAGSAARNAWWLPLVTNKGQSIDGEALLVCSCSTGGPVRVCPTFLGGRLACTQHMETDLLECETVPCAFLPQVFYSFDWHARRKQRIIEKKNISLQLCFLSIPRFCI